MDGVSYLRNFYQSNCQHLMPINLELEEIYVTWVSAGCKINLIDVNFHHQKSLNIFEENSADKIQLKKNKGQGVKVPFLMPIWVNAGPYFLKTHVGYETPQKGQQALHLYSIVNFVTS
jgi:hypothetical protein